MIKSFAASSVARFASLGGALSLILDLAQPLLPFAALASVTFLVLSLVAFGLSTISPIRSFALKASGFCVVSFFFATGTWGLQQVLPEGSEKGVLASNFPVISELQDQLAGIAESNKEIAKNTRETADQTKIIAEVTKKETSEDPRKELANLGVSWTEKSFWEAVDLGDRKVINLFLAGGIRLDEEILLETLIFENVSEDSLEVFQQFAIDYSGEICTLEYSFSDGRLGSYRIYERLVDYPNEAAGAFRALKAICGERKISSSLEELESHLEEQSEQIESSMKACVRHVYNQRSPEELLFLILDSTILKGGIMELTKITIDNQEVNPKPSSALNWNGHLMKFRATYEDTAIAMSGFSVGYFSSTRSHIDEYVRRECRGAVGKSKQPELDKFRDLITLSKN